MVLRKALETRNCLAQCNGGPFIACWTKISENLGGKHIDFPLCRCECNNYCGTNTVGSFHRGVLDNSILSCKEIFLTRAAESITVAKRWIGQTILARVPTGLLWNSYFIVERPISPCSWLLARRFSSRGKQCQSPWQSFGMGKKSLHAYLGVIQKYTFELWHWCRWTTMYASSLSLLAWEQIDLEGLGYSQHSAASLHSNWRRPLSIKFSLWELLGSWKRPIGNDTICSGVKV